MWTLWQEETAQAVTTLPPPNPVCFFTTHWLIPHPPRLSWEQSQQSSKLKQQLTLYTVAVRMDVCTAWKRPCGFRRRQVRVLWRQLRRLQEGYFQQNLHRLKSVLSSYFTQCTYTFYAKTKNDMRQQKNKKMTEATLLIFLTFTWVATAWMSASLYQQELCLLTFLYTQHTSSSFCQDSWRVNDCICTQNSSHSDNAYMDAFKMQSDWETFLVYHL